MGGGVIVDLFAGPGGWDQGLTMLGHRDVVGLEIDRDACRTAQAAGHMRVQADVAEYPPEAFGRVEGLLASPPCQDFSQANRNARGTDTERGQLVYEVLRWVEALRPRWVACEQVPRVLPLWRRFAYELEQDGYETWVGKLTAADYGVPQTRTRAFLLASLTQTPMPPAASHGERPGLLGLKPWVTMADALGWGMPDRPSYTVMSGGADTGGAEPFGQWARESMRDRIVGDSDAGWVFRRPATTVVGSFCPDVIAAPGYRTEVSRQDAPGSVRCTVSENGVLQSFPHDYPWQGSKTSKFRQVGNAVPPLLAARLLDQFVAEAQEVAA